MQAAGVRGLFSYHRGKAMKRGGENQGKASLYAEKKEEIMGRRKRHGRKLETEQRKKKGGY